MVDDIEHMIWLLLSETCAPGYRIERFSGGSAAFRYGPVKLSDR
jgi:hypothetical protein